ncbi:Amino acid/polyamine transporter I [Trinorchestia longiramus]|nr:Amino acid/polyamine transporter I [Trinorchestia longiramus]
MLLESRNAARKPKCCSQVKTLLASRNATRKPKCCSQVKTLLSSRNAARKSKRCSQIEKLLVNGAVAGSGTHPIYPGYTPHTSGTSLTPVIPLVNTPYNPNIPLILSVHYYIPRIHTSYLWYTSYTPDTHLIPLVHPGYTPHTSDTPIAIWGAAAGSIWQGCHDCCRGSVNIRGSQRLCLYLWATFGNRVLGAAAVVMPLAVTLSTFGAANGTAFTSGRLCFVAAREGHMVDVLSYVHVQKKTPSTALIFNAAIALLMVIPSDIGSLIDFFSFTAWIFYGGAMVALLVLRRTRPNAYRPYKVPIVIPILVLIVSVYLVIGPIIDDPQIEYLYATCFIIAGLLFYAPFVHKRYVLPGMGHVTTFFQLLLQVVPTDIIPDP